LEPTNRKHKKNLGTFPASPKSKPEACLIQSQSVGTFSEEIILKLEENVSNDTHPDMLYIWEKELFCPAKKWFEKHLYSYLRIP